MASVILNAMKQKGNHEVGNINAMKVRTLNHGALVEGSIDNFTLGELGFNANGERTVKQLSAHTKKGVLVASPENLFLNEPMVNFYNAEGERARTVYLDEGVRFQTSAFEKNTGITEVKGGQFAHWKAATKKFLIHDGTHADYTAAKDKFVVVGNEEDLDYTLGKPMVRLEVLA